jgi:hypothetical protein
VKKEIHRVIRKGTSSATKVLSLLMVIGLRTSPKSVRKQEHPPKKHECQKRAAGKKMDGSNQSVGYFSSFFLERCFPRVVSII